MYNRILLAIDFSAQPQLLYRFGLDLAQQLGSSLDLVHIFHPKQLKGRLRSGKSAKELLPYFQQRLAQLTPLVLGNAPQVPPKSAKPVKKIVLKGAPELELLKFSRQPEIDLIVLGINAFSYPFNEDFGKVVTEVSQEASCPILLLPPDVFFFGFHKILFVTDSEQLNAEILEHISSLAYLFNAEIIILNVYYPGTATSEEHQVEEDLAALHSGIPFSWAATTYEDMLESINRYLVQEEIDLINILDTSRSLWLGFLKNKMKNAYQLQRDVPILVHHFED